MTAGTSDPKGPTANPHPVAPTESEADKDGEPAVNPVLDVAAGLVLAALSLFALLWLIPTQTKEAAGAYDVSPGFFPRVSAATVLILSVLFVVHRVIRFRQMRRGPRPGAGGAVLTEVAVWTVTCAAIWVGLWQAGFLVVAPLIVAIAMIAAGVRRGWLIAVLAATTTAATYVGADLLFDVALP